MQLIRRGHRGMTVPHDGSEGTGYVVTAIGVQKRTNKYVDHKSKCFPCQP